MCNREISLIPLNYFFREALRPSGADRQDVSYQPSRPSTGEGGEIQKKGEG